MSFFGNFFDIPGMNIPGMNVHSQMPSRKNVNNKKYYEILGIDKSANEKEVRKAYLKKSIKGEYCHPDKGGTEEKFKILSKAYEVLKDKQKRHIYDTQGEDGLKNGGPGGINPFDMSSMFFGKKANTEKNIQKGKSTVFNIKLTLEELCQNTTKKIKITRKVIFNKKTNTQLPDHKVQDSWMKCPKCGGSGMISKIRQVGPGFIQQMQSPCEHCNRTGHIFSDDFEVREIKEVLTMFVEKGSVNGDKIKFSHKGNATPGKIPGDLLVMIHEKKHPVYSRKNNDLLLKKSITLQEALFGYEFYLNHPDGRILKIKNEPNTVTCPKTNLKCAEGFGMPIKEDSYRNGKLFICLEIIFPMYNEISNNQLINKLFSEMSSYNNRIKKDRLSNYDPEDAEDVILNNVDLSQFGKKERKQKSAQDSDSEDEHPQFHQQPQCRQM